jgi:hypothetical protein
MTQNEHKLLASLLLFITWQLFLKRFFYYEEELAWWKEFFKKWL